MTPFSSSALVSDADLFSTELLACDGKVSHTLTLLIDGTVRIRFSSGAVGLVDPTTRTVLTRGIEVQDALMDCAVSLANELTR
jgi:hypothetical protein